ncbi:MAG TPA: DUF1540 domain-containing protein [Clostridia bacterium]|nr:DUF1540 domain-containing protein [Clostridia bacterium]
MANIKCSVEECAYWNDMVCTANAIEVRSSGDRQVKTSDGTCCETFVPNNQK